MSKKEEIKQFDTTLTPEEKSVLAKNANGQATDERFVPSFEKVKEYKTARLIMQIITYTFLTIFAFFMLMPFIFMITVSIKGPLEYNEEIMSGLRLFTKNPTFINFKVILDRNLGDKMTVQQLEQILPADLVVNIGKAGQNKYSFAPYFINTLFVALTSTIFTVGTTVLASFAFARLEFKTKNALFAVLLATMMVPGEIMLITNYKTAEGMGLANTFSALIFVHGVSVFYIFYLRQTFQQIPNELFLASKVDGYGEFKYLWRVMIPIGMPTIVTITILNVMGSWNAYIWPTLIANGNHAFLSQLLGYEYPARLVSNGLMKMFEGEFGSIDTVRIAGSMVVSAPLLLVFILFRKYIMRGVSRSGIKG